MTPFEALLRYYLSPLLERKGLNVVKAQMTTERLKNNTIVLQKYLQAVRERMKDYYNLKRSKGPILEEGGKVYLLRRNIRLKRPYKKLDFKKYSLYRIKKKFLDLVYKLKLPKGSYWHLVFHISLLELALANIPL